MTTTTTHRFQKYLTDTFGPKPNCQQIIDHLKVRVAEDADIVLMAKGNGWRKLRQRYLESTREIDQMMLALNSDPQKNDRRIRDLLATKRAIIGLIAMVESTDRQFADKVKRIESELKTMREITAQSPLNLFFWKQTT